MEESDEANELRDRIFILEKRHVAQNERINELVERCNQQSAIFQADLRACDANFAALTALLKKMVMR